MNGPYGVGGYQGSTTAWAPASASEPLCLRTSDPSHVAHMTAVTDACRSTVDLNPVDDGGECTYPYAGLPHAYECNPAEVETARADNGGYDEFERCGHPVGHSVHGDRDELGAQLDAEEDELRFAEQWGEAQGRRTQRLYPGPY